jgi:hypothetical protein
MMRSTRFVLTALLIVAAAQPAPAATLTHSPAAVGTTPLSQPPSVSTVRAAMHPPTPPAPHRAPLSMDLSVLGVALATKRATRRSTGKKRDVPMFLDSEVHVMREGKDGKPEQLRIAGGVLVDDTELEDDEIDELTARRVIRPATQDEIHRLERRETDDARTELLRTHETEMAQLRAQHDVARAELENSGNATPAALNRLSDKQALEITKLQDKHAAAIAKIDEA